MEKIYLETLGCSKNQIDSEKMLFLLIENGYEITLKPEEASYIIINTCVFIDKAKKEAIDTIFELNKYKETGKCRKLIVAGCLAEIYSNELIKEIPEIDNIIGIGDISKILDSVKLNEKIIKPEIKKNTLIKRKFLSFPGSAYIKISEGCSNFCSYCMIPHIRGTLASREIREIIKEVEFLKENGIKEYVLISQDTANFGIDIYNKKSLDKLILEISKILDKNDWLRILYMHPDHIDKNMLIQFLKINNFLPYFDIPFQSGSDKILKSMNRINNSADNIKLIKNINELFDKPVIRSTFITGFPDENNDDFEKTLNFIKEIKIEWIGGFTYSREEKTPSGKMKNQVNEKIKKNRLEVLLNLSEKISIEKLKRFLNTKQRILIEETVKNENLYLGRFWGQAPEVDGLTVIKSENAKPGSFVNAEIKKLNEKDFYAVEN